ncbi:MAG: hypothetical protein AB1529_05805 [Candidatus Micrarchaeota archaeon]
MSDQKMQCASLAQEKGEKKRWRPFSGLVEGLRTRKARRKAISLAESAIRSGEAEDLSDALESYSALPDKRKAETLLYLQKRLKSASSFTYESPQKVRTLTVIADFFAEAAKSLPKDAEGALITAPYSRTISLLKGAVEKKDLYKSGDETHAQAVLSSVKALWELEYGYIPFWEERLSDPDSRKFTIRKMLGMEPAEKFEDHGWYFLMRNIDTLAVDIGQSDSPAKHGFFLSMLAGSEPAVIRAALRGAAYLDSDGELRDMAKELLAIDALSEAAGEFLLVCDLKDRLSKDGADRYGAALGLADLYANGAKHLKPMLDNMCAGLVGSAMSEQDGREKVRLLDAISDMALLGIAPYSPGTLQELLEPVVGSKEAMGAYYTITGALIERGNGLSPSAAALEQRRIMLALEALQFADDRQFDAAMELITLYRHGRSNLVNAMVQIAEDMVDVKFNPGGQSEGEKAGQKNKAESVIRALGSVGVRVNIEVEGG